MSLIGWIDWSWFFVGAAFGFLAMTAYQVWRSRAVLQGMSDTVVCGACWGSGDVIDHTGRIKTCPACGGSGVVRK